MRKIVGRAFRHFNALLIVIAEAAGAAALVELLYSVHYPVVFNNLELTTVMIPSVQKSAGAENVLLKPAKTGSEDFSFYAQKVPGLFFSLGGMPKGKDPKTAGNTSVSGLPTSN